MTEEDFYQHKGYWERVADNQAHFLGLNHPTTLDVVILLPLLPLFPLAILWMLPWEGWVGKNVPKPLIGPYVLYCAFALWHFHAGWWQVLLVVVFGAGLCARTLKDMHDRGEST